MVTSDRRRHRPVSNQRGVSRLGDNAVRAVAKVRRTVSGPWITRFRGLLFLLATIVCILSANMGDPVPAKVRYSRLKTLFKKRLSLARDLLASRVAVYEQIKDTREELKSSVRELEVCSVMCDEADCTDLDQLQTESQRVVSDMASRMETLRNEKERDGKARLTEIKTPKFSGDVCEYISFKAKFSDLVVARTTDKIALLKLRDEALREGSSEHMMTLGAATVTEAFQYLDRQFADVETQRNAFIVKLKRLPTITDWYDSVALRKLVGMLRSTRAAFSMLNCDSLDSATFSALMSKLPEALRREIDAKVFDQKCRTIDGRFQIFIELCERQAAMSETHTYRTEAYATSAYAPSCSVEPKFVPQTSLVTQSRLPNTSQSQLVSDSGTPTCLFHPKSQRHKTSVCNQLLILPTVQVLDTLRSNGHCFRCFEKHDLQRKCGVTCPEPGCPQPHTHGKILHTAFVVKSPISSAATVNAVGIEQANPFALLAEPACPSSVRNERGSGGRNPPEVIQEFDGYASDSSNTALTGSCLETSVVDPSVSQNVQELGLCSLRPCQAAYTLGTNGHLLPVNLLYDMASDLSQISENTTRKTPLQPCAVIENLYMHVAGDRTARSFGKSTLFSVPIYDSSGTMMFEVRCWSVPFIGKLRAVDIGESLQRFQSHGFDCSTIQSPPSGDIQILVGCNYSSHHPIPVSTVEGVTLARTAKASILYGAHKSFRAVGSFPTISTQLQTVAIVDAHVDSLPTAYVGSPHRIMSMTSSSLDTGDVQDCYRISQTGDTPSATHGRPRSTPVNLLDPDTRDAAVPISVGLYSQWQQWPDGPTQAFGNMSSAQSSDSLPEVEPTDHVPLLESVSPTIQSLGVESATPLTQVLNDGTLPAALLETNSVVHLPDSAWGVRSGLISRGGRVIRNRLLFYSRYGRKSRKSLMIMIQQRLLCVAVAVVSSDSQKFHLDTG